MRYKLVSKPFKIWDMANCYMPFQEAGCFSVVLKCVLAPIVVAAATSALRIPTIGIGAGTFCSGQVN
ncbi:hypothetical protein LOK49_LG05G02772 [Camellia lanceoleosa]|uniref:Uncharacterized protein n=1 Tax=Camellia lanceoleosa TaxID=1840588 RepID=A0ACC0HQ25_9ERIC|nr:hypothetical protein LOK49_LG05G02772 [Camellia lanceoleosa]